MSLIHVSYGSDYDNPTLRFLRGAKVPAHVGPKVRQTQEIGNLRYLWRQPADGMASRILIGATTMMTLCEWTEETIHKAHGYVVMEDSFAELRRHLPIWMTAHGRVLVSGLGLGCVVRGLLLKPEVDHIDVLEIDGSMIAAIGPEFAQNPRVTIHHTDAFGFPLTGRAWNFGWHDISTPDDHHLQTLHGDLMKRFWSHIEWQGAWAFPREVSRRLPYRLLGAPKTPRNRGRVCP